MRDVVLESAEILDRLAGLPDWQLADDGKAISRRFKFGNFRTAFAFMTECALMAERLDHHPDWTNVYNRVDVLLTTHVIAGLSERDFRLAAGMDAAAARYIETDP